jgi:hypothetical protein
MSLRNRFRPGDAFPKSGVVTPDVFPDPDRNGHEELDLHDILEGRIPGVRRGQTPRRGWLRIAFGNGEDRDYTRPGTVTLGGRALSTIEINVDVEEAIAIRRVSTTIDDEALESPVFNGRSFRFGESNDGLVKVDPVEQAIAFSGIADIRDVERVVQGIHFASGHENGWLHIGAPVEPLNPAA